MEGAQRRRSILGKRDRPGTARLAHRMFRDGHEVSGRDARHPRGWRGSDLSTSRKRNRAIGSHHLEAVRALLVALGVPERRVAEDGEVGGELLYLAGSAGRRLSTGSGALSAGFGALSQEAELHLRWV